MVNLTPTPAELAQYAEDGYFLRSGLLEPGEVSDFRDHARRQLAEEQSAGRVMSKRDREGNTTLIRLWATAEDDKYGLLARDERMVRLAEACIKQPVYLYSHKVTMKQPNQGGAWEWHQDFGYWHDYGCFLPDMMSIFVALDDATRQNGCLQVLKGSHAAGRLNHFRQDEQTTIASELVDVALKRFERVFVEMQAGDALVFHCNLIHRSDANLSDSYRWGYICSYNSVSNAPFKDVRDYGGYHEMKMVPAGTFRSVP